VSVVSVVTSVKPVYTVCDPEGIMGVKKYFTTPPCAVQTAPKYMLGF